MTRKRVFGLFLIVSISIAVVVLGAAAFSPAAAADDAPPLSPDEKQDFSRGRTGRSVRAGTGVTADLYGYTVSTVASQWMDATSGTEIEFSTRDDDSFGPIPIGFSFPFYENTFADLYVSTNGMISFGVASDTFENRDIPRDTFPDNYIAPFWDDLLFLIDELTGDPISRAYYRAGSDAQGNYFVVEWNQVSRLETQSDILTFEVVLRENGDIRLQYQQLSGTLDEATVGIEDDKGVDGSLFLYNSAGLNTAQAVLFEYPATSPRAKIYPLSRGNLTRSRIGEVSFTVRNSGNSGADTYDLLLSAYDPNWEVTFFDGSGAALVDSDNDGTVDTGSIAQGSEVLVKVRVIAPDSAEIGDSINVNLSVVSSLNSAHQAQAVFQVAVPTAFAQALLNSTLMQLQLVWRQNQISALASPEQFTGSNLGVQRLVNGNYFYSWERNGFTTGSVSYADLKFTIISDLGGTLLEERNLTDNSAVTDRTEDRFLMSDVTSNGQVGVVWVRSRYRDFGSGSEVETKSNQNIFFAVLNQNGDVVISPQNLTQNTDWRGKNDINVPYFVSPRIATTDDDRFMLSWTKDVLQSGGKVSDIEYVVYAANGTQVKSRTILTASQPDGIYYITPNLVDMLQNHVMLSYSVVDPLLETKSLAFQVLDSSGNVVTAETAISGSDGGTTHDTARLGNGNLVVAWSSDATGDVGFVVLDGLTTSVVSAAQYMTSPNLRDAFSVSVARDSAGRGVITWGDRNETRYLYYALISETGDQITSEMIYLIAIGTSVLNTNSYGYGLTSYEGTWREFMPHVSR